MQDESLPFHKPDELTLRVHRMGEVTIYRLDHPTVRMEVNVMVGDLLALARIATQTSLQYHPPGETEPGPLPEQDRGLLGGLFLGAVEADTHLEAGDVTVLRDGKGQTQSGHPYVERTLLAERLGAVKHVAMVFGPGSRGAIVGYMTGRKDLETVDAWKESVLHSVEFPDADSP